MEICNKGGTASPEIKAGDVVWISIKTWESDEGQQILGDLQLVSAAVSFQLIIA